MVRSLIPPRAPCSVRRDRSTSRNRERASSMSPCRVRCERFSNAWRTSIAPTYFATQITRYSPPACTRISITPAPIAGIGFTSGSGRPSCTRRSSSPARRRAARGNVRRSRREEPTQATGLQCSKYIRCDIIRPPPIDAPGPEPRRTPAAGRCHATWVEALPGKGDGPTGRPPGQALVAESASAAHRGGCRS